MTIPSTVPVSLHPLLHRAEALAASRHWSEAIAFYEQALALVPNEPYTLVQLSYVNSLYGKYRRAEEFALAAAQAETTDPSVLAELLRRLRTFNQVPAMLACIERAKPLSGMSIPLLIVAAAQLTYVNLPERAIELLDEAHRADPDYPTTLLARTQVLTYLGRFAEAEEDVARAIRRAPEIAQAYWLQAGLRRQLPDHNHVDAIKRELGRRPRSADEIALLAFALHKELDDLERYDEAWEALVIACRAKRSRLNYDGAATKSLFSDLASFESTVKSTPTQVDGVVPIFIVGMHRSGTTLLEQMLDGNSDVKAIGELYDFTSAMRYITDYHCKGVIDARLVELAQHSDLDQAGRRYLESVAWRLGERAVFTDKLPSNFLNIGFIAQALPNAKILHMVRDPIETCFSNLRELFSDANPYSYDLVELVDYYTMYRDLMTTWRERFPGRVLDVDYAELVSNPKAQLQRVAEFCSLRFDESMLDVQARKRPVVTASAVQVREAVRGRNQPKWVPYKQWLTPMLKLFDNFP
jgi:tetratricopeptide (TPR) repeat protein